MQAFLSVVLLLSAASAGLSPCEDDPSPFEEELKKLSGTWQMVSAQLAGEKFPDDFVRNTTLVISGDNYVVTVGDAKDEGKVRVVTGKRPKAMDITGVSGPNKGRTFLTVYHLDRDTLRVCYDLAGKNRPTEFKTQPGTKLFLATYKRSKPWSGRPTHGCGSATTSAVPPQCRVTAEIASAKVCRSTSGW